MKDIYRHPTIRSLAAALADAAPARRSGPPGVPAPGRGRRRRPARVEYVLCGALQLLVFLGYVYLAALCRRVGYAWISGGSGMVGIYLRSVLFGGAAFVRAVHAADPGEVGAHRPVEAAADPHLEPGVRPVLDRQDAGPVEPAGALSPARRCTLLYLRALGAKVGRGAAIFSHHVPVCTDLLTIGAGTVIRKDAFFQCYRAQAGWIQTGAVTLGRDVFVGEKTVLDIDTSMGDGAQLGHTSALHSGQAVPAGERWHGSPAQRTDGGLPAGRAGRLRHAAPGPVYAVGRC